MNQNGTHNELGQQSGSLLKGINAIPWITGAILLLGLATVAGIYWGRTVRVQSVHFSGYHFIEPEELNRHINISLGVKSDSLDYLSIIESVERIPYVKYANVSVDPAGNLLIQVTERQPLAMLADGEQKVYVDADGLKLPMVLGKAADIPVLYGFRVNPVDDTLRSVAYRAVSDFLVEVSRRPVSNATISELVWTDKEGIVALTNENGVKLIFGKNDFPSRLRNWEAFYAEIVRQKGMGSMQLVDLRFRGQIVTRES